MPGEVNLTLREVDVCLKRANCAWIGLLVSGKDVCQQMATCTRHRLLRPWESKLLTGKVTCTQGKQLVAYGGHFCLGRATLAQ